MGIRKSKRGGPPAVATATHSPRPKLPPPAMVVATLALFLALGGAAYAVQIAAKNSVTSKSIKNGTIKGQDIATGGVQFMSTNDLPTGPNATTLLPPVGLLNANDAGVKIGVELFAPVALTVGDFHASGGALGLGEARQFSIVITSSSPSSTVVGCTVQAERFSCKSAKEATIRAGEFFTPRVQNGAGGANAETAQVAYTMKPK